jgi:filamentous hemagglutinin family protein
MSSHVKKLFSVFLILTFILYPQAVYALPQGGVVKEGTANLVPSGNTLTINQSSDKAVIDYDSFSIANGETVNFDQTGPSAMALNRVTGGSISEIFGTLSADGIVYLVNTNGVIFSPGAALDLSGLVASTLDITNTDFMNGDYDFTLNQREGQSVGSVINQAELSAPGGFIALLGPHVENQTSGEIYSNMGTVALASGDATTLSLDGNDLISVVVTQEASLNPGEIMHEAGVVNDGKLSAEHGKVLVTADVLDSVFDNAINNSGIVEARNIYVWGDGTVNITEGSQVNALGQVQNVDNYVEVFISNYGESGDVQINGSTVTALLDARFAGSARIFGWADGALNVTDSTLSAEVQGFATGLSGAGDYISEELGITHPYLDSYEGALVSLMGGTDVVIDPSVVSANVTSYDYYGEIESVVQESVGGDGDARVMVDTKYADIEIQGNSQQETQVTAGVKLDGNADIVINAGEGTDLTIGQSGMIASVGQNGDASVQTEAGQVNVSASYLESRVLGTGSAVTSLIAEGQNYESALDHGAINVTGASTVKSRVDSGGHAEVAMTTGQDNPFDVAEGVEVTGGDINIEDTALIRAETVGVYPTTALITFLAAHDLNIQSNTTVSAFAEDFDPAFVVGVAANAINALGRIEAVSTENLAGIGLFAMQDIAAHDVFASGSDTVDGMDLLEDLASSYLGSEADLENQYVYASGILIASVLGDVTLGDVEADLVVAAAVGLDGIDLQPIADLILEEYTLGQEGHSLQDVAIGDLSPVEEETSIVNTTGDVSAHMAYFLAKNHLGESSNPIATDADIVAGYSYQQGNIFIDQVTDKTLAVGMHVPVSVWEEGAEVPESGFLGASLAASDGIISVTSATDMIVNSVVAAQGGVFMQSREGSIYAGTGWDPSVHGEMPSEWMQFLMPFPWEEGPYFSPVILEENGEQDMNLHLIASGSSYLSTPVGTIGVGTQDSKDPDNSGQVTGYVTPLVTTVNDDQGIGLDLRYGVPPGYVVYEDLETEGSVQVWPEIVNGDPGAQSFENPLMVYVDVVQGAPLAVPDGFPEGDDALAGLTLQIGNETPVPPTPPLPPTPPSDDGEEELAYNIQEGLRAYYELLDRYRMTSMQPIVPTEYYAYHPVAPTDTTGFNDIQLDADAYEFIDGNLNPNNPLAPYFGEEDEQGN